MEIVCIVVMALLTSITLAMRALLKDKKEEIKWLETRLKDLGDEPYIEITKGR